MKRTFFKDNIIYKFVRRLRISLASLDVIIGITLGMINVE